MDPAFFSTPSEFREWLDVNHDTADEIWVGYYRKESGKPSLTWPQSVDQAICYGWIDGIRKSIDDESYKIRFTPRRPDSIWSEINIMRAQALIEEGFMQPVGFKAYLVRKENKSGVYSYEQRRAELEPPYDQLLKQNAAAWDFFQSQTASYRKAISWWVISAKKEETRLSRLEKLISYSLLGQLLPEFVSRKSTH